MTDRRVIANKKAAGAPAGLTLIEVLIAMAILGIGLAVIFQGIGLGLRVRRDSEVIRRIAVVADRELNRLQIDAVPPEEPRSGEEGGVSWTVEQHPDITYGGGEDEERETNLVPVRITVTADNGRSREIVTLMRKDEE